MTNHEFGKLALREGNLKRIRDAILSGTGPLSEAEEGFIDAVRAMPCRSFASNAFLVKIAARRKQLTMTEGV